MPSRQITLFIGTDNLPLVNEVIPPYGWRNEYTIRIPEISFGALTLSQGTSYPRKPSPSVPTVPMVKAIYRR